MNQDQIKEQLLTIKKNDVPFSVILSGKKSKKVNGLYKAERREIILHNKNFSSDNELMYTAIHEYAHHIQFTASPVPISIRIHTVRFWSLFHNLLNEAEAKGIYKNPFEENDEFISLTQEIKEKFLARNGELMKELGRLLMRARELCEKHRTSFTDYLDRILILPRNSANTIIKTHLFDLDPRTGYENMKFLTKVKDPFLRKESEQALLSGTSQDMVKQKVSSKPEKKDAIEELEAEKMRLEKQIQRLKRRLDEIIKRLHDHAKLQSQ